jgi:hypothetical protein
VVIAMAMPDRVDARVQAAARQHEHDPDRGSGEGDPAARVGALAAERDAAAR